MVKRSVVIVLALGLLLTLTSCTGAEYTFKQIKSKLEGLPAVVETFDENSQLIDYIEGTSVDVAADNKFAQKDSEGNTTQKSSVLSIIIGEGEMTHVGSSLILREKGLEDRFRDFTERVDISNFSKSTPIVQRFVDDFKNVTTGKSRLILVRSQSGMPLAAFEGDSVSIFSTEIDKTTILLVDGKLLLIYRCDYTIYDTVLLAQKG